AAGADLKLSKNWLLGAVLAKMNEQALDDATRLREHLPPLALASLVTLIERGTISGSTAKGVFEKMFESGRSPDEIVAAEGLTQISDDSHIIKLVADVLAANGDAVEQYRRGKGATFGFLVGQVMKA